jgi:hypothetical protein
MWQKQISKLGADHRIADHDKLANALGWAWMYYDSEKYPFSHIDEAATDTLDKVAAALSLVTSYLCYDRGLPNLNLMRLIDQLAASNSAEFGPSVARFEALDGEAIPIMGTTGAWIDRCSSIDQKIEEWLDTAGTIQVAAERAHAKRARGSPGRDRSLRAAAATLSTYWTDTLGRKITVSKWERMPDGELVPEGGELALFLLDAMKIIDPGRKRLGEELRYLMVTLKKNSRRIKRKPRM